MKRFFMVLSAVVGLSLVGVSTAQAAGGGCDCGGPATQAPVQAPKTAQVTPGQATTAQAQPTTGYRTYSYQPSYYQPAPSYRSYNRMPTAGFHDAGWKIRGGN
jgi:hypothetical protein